MHIVFFLHGNIRSGANLVMLRHAVHMAASARVDVVFQHDWFDLDMTFVPGHAALAPVLLRDYLAAQPGRADVAITNWWTCAYDLPAIPARRYAYYRHGDERALYDTPIFDALFAWIEQERFAWLCVNEQLAQPLTQAGHRPLVLPPGVDLHLFQSALPALPPSTERMRVLVEGPLDGALKRIRPTIGMLREIEGIEIVHMAADGSRADHVHHALGALAHQDVPGVYAACDVLVKLSALESFGMPVLEQFAAGGTAIVSAFPGHDALVVDGQNGFVVDLDNPFAAARDRLLRLRDDPPLLKSMRSTAQMAAAGYDWSGIHTRFEGFVREIASEEGDRALPLAEAFSACLHATIAAWSRACTQA